MKKFPYESCFAELVIKPIVSEEKDKCLALASLEEVRHFLPNVDSSANLDLLPVAFNACVINRVNKNKDVVDTNTALAMYKQFINKPINVEHNRQKVIGMILTAGFSEFGSDRPLTEEQVRGMTGPFNITLGGIIWRVVCPELADHIEEASDPTSDKYLSVSASWELGFTDYRVALMEGGVKNLAEATKIISDPLEVDKVRDSLTSLGGDGKIEDLFAYRMPSYEVLPLGIGFTEKPAAEVKGVATETKEQANLTNPEAFHNEPHKEQIDPVPVPAPVPAQKTINLPQRETFGEAENENKISQSVKSDVKTERITKAPMKITSLKDITDESLKECTASAVSEFIASELTKGNDSWLKEKAALNTQLTEAKAEAERIKTEQETVQKELAQVKAQVTSLAEEKAQREKVEQFNTRMAEVSEAYNLDDEIRGALVEEIKAIASDEDFTKWKAKAAILLKGFAKKAKCKAEDDEDAEAKKAKAAAEAAASDKTKDKGTAVAAAVDNAIDNADKNKGGLPNGSTANQPSLIEKYKSAFAKEGFEIRM
jgi:hypothetical protein